MPVLRAVAQLLEQLRRGIEGLLVSDSPESLFCVLEQDTPSAAYYWFNIGRQEIISTWLKVKKLLTTDQDVKHQCQQIWYMNTVLIMLCCENILYFSISSPHSKKGQKNSEDPDQTASDVAVRSGSTLYAILTSIL